MKLAYVIVGVSFLLGCPSDPKPATPDEPSSQACTEEAKICPDGSSVGRTGPDCAFAPCPEPTAQPSAQPGEPQATCKDECGNGTCEEMVCQAVGCPCSESAATCPKDCK